MSQIPAARFFRNAIGLPVFFALSALFMFSCKGPEGRERKEGDRSPAEGARGVPEWVTRGGGALDQQKKGRIIYGVGAISGVENPGLLRRASEDNARVAVAKVLHTYVTSLAKNYARSVGNMESTAEEQLIQETTKVYTEITIGGIQIGEHYYDKPTRTMYTQAYLDLEVFKDAIPKAPALKSEVREYIQKNADKAFEELEKSGPK